MIMTDVEVKKSIRKVADLARKLDIDKHHCTFEPIDVDPELKKLCKATPYYREIYDYVATHNQYNLMLNDNSCFQFSESLNRNNGQELRYAYYPNPYRFIEFKEHLQAVQELFDQGEISLIEYEQLLNECNFTHHIPIIRYDYSPSQYNPSFHPASHFHIGFHSENRWPIGRVISPYLFFLKILSMYYSDIWTKNFEVFPDKTLNDIYFETKSHSYAVPSDYMNDEDTKRLLIS